MAYPRLAANAAHSPTDATGDGWPYCGVSVSKICCWLNKRTRLRAVACQEKRDRLRSNILSIAYKAIIDKAFVAPEEKVVGHARRQRRAREVANAREASRKHVARRLSTRGVRILTCQRHSL